VKAPTRPSRSGQRYRHRSAGDPADAHRLNHLFARATGQPLERIEEDTHRNFWLDADAAVRYGLAGKIIERVDELDRATPRSA